MKRNTLHSNLLVFTIGLQALLIMFLAAPLITIAGGATVIINNSPARWREFPIVMKIDQGTLGDLSEEETFSLIRESLDAWNNVSTSKLEVLEGERLDTDYTAENFDGDTSVFVENDINPILLDNNGEMIDAFYGIGAKESILGVGTPYVLTSGPNAGTIINGGLILNGWHLSSAAGDQQNTKEETVITVIHELGHVFNLDHAQIYRHINSDGFIDNDIYIPIMYPKSSKGDALRHVPVFDDCVAISTLYPADDGSFEAGTGTIAGRVVMTDGHPLLGGNVIARNVESRYTIVASCVSDYLKKETGEFRIVGLPPGNYEVWIEPVYPEFIGGSSVGPYSEVLTDPSFTNPPRPEYYNGSNEAGSESLDYPCQVTPVQVEAGEETTIEMIVQPLTNELEREAFLLALDTPEFGGTIGDHIYYLEPDATYAVIVDEHIDDLTVTVTPHGQRQLKLCVNRDARVNAAAENQIDSLLASAEGETLVYEMSRTAPSSTDGPVMQDGTYYFTVLDYASGPGEFTISASSGGMPQNTPVPTSTPSPTPTQEVQIGDWIHY